MKGGLSMRGGWGSSSHFSVHSEAFRMPGLVLPFTERGRAFVALEKSKLTLS